MSHKIIKIQWQSQHQRCEVLKTLYLTGYLKMILYRNITRLYKKNYFTFPHKRKTSKSLMTMIIALLSFPVMTNQAYSATVQPDKPSWSYSLKKRAVPILTQTLFSIDKLQTQSPLLSWALKSSLLKAFQTVSQGKNMNIFCTADQAGFVLIHALLCLYINQSQAIDDVRWHSLLLISKNRFCTQACTILHHSRGGQ